MEVPTLKEKVSLKIPPGTSPGKIFRLKGLGSPNLRSRGVGDQLVKVNVEIPKKLTQRQRELLEEFAKTTDDHLNHNSEGILGKVKHFFET